MPIATDSPVCIKLTDSERDSGVMSDIKLFSAIAAVHTDGVVVIENAIDVCHIDHLNERMTADAARYLAGHKALRFAGTFKEGAEAAVGGGNLSMVPPLEKEYMRPEIYANSHAHNILRNVLGPEPELRYIRSNTLTRSVNRQMVHGDISGEFPNFTTGMVYNTYLVDTGPHNGSTEMWLGTHSSPMEDRIAFEKAQIADEVLEARRRVRPPIQPTIRKGSIVLRDTRMWHAGVPNPSDEVRVMLALMFFAKWWKNSSTTSTPESLRPHILELERLSRASIPCSWVQDGGFDYLENEFAVTRRSVLAPDGW